MNAILVMELGFQEIRLLEESCMRYGLLLGFQEIRFFEEPRVNAHTCGRLRVLEEPRGSTNE
jgi:hypothetical protein